MAKQIELQKLNENENENESENENGHGNNSSFGAAVKRVYNNQFNTRKKQLESEGYKITGKHEVVPSSSVFDDNQQKETKITMILPPKIKVVNDNKIKINNNN
eukprot:749596_1